MPVSPPASSPASRAHQMHSYYGGPISQSPVAQQVLLNRRQRQCPVLLESTVSVPRPLGVRFVENRHRSRDSLNLTVVHELQPSGELATSTPQLQLGMVLSRIGGDSVVGQQHAAVMDALQARPLRLTFVDSLHKVMRVVTDGDLRAAYEYAMSVRNAHGGGGGGGSASHSAAAATAALASSAARHQGKGLLGFEKRQDDTATVQRDLENELRLTPGDAELTLWLHEVEEMGTELRAATAQRLDISTAQRRPPPQLSAQPGRSESEIKQVVDTQMAKATVAADQKWMAERKAKTRKELTEVDELGSLVLNAGRRLELLRAFFAKHDPAREDATIKAQWETNGGKCSDTASAYALEEDNLSFSELLTRLAGEFGEDPLRYYQDEQRKRLRTTQLSAHRLERHSVAIREAEDAYVRSAVEAKAVDDAAAKMRERLAGTGNGPKPKVDREPHTVAVKFWSDEKPMGLSLEHWHSVARLGHRYVRITGIAPDSLADEIAELEKGMTIEAINDVAPRKMRDGGSDARSLDAIYQALRQRPVLVTFGFQIAEQAEEKALEDTRKTQAAVRDYAGVDDRTIAAKLRALGSRGSGVASNGGLVSFDELDVNGDGKVSRLEYLQVLEKKQSQVVVESVRDRDNARQQEERTVVARRQQEAREISHAVHELRKAALSEDMKLMQSTLADYEGFENPDVAVAWEALEVALIETDQRARRKVEEAKEREARALRLEQEAADRKRLAERQRRSPARERATAEITAHKIASRTNREDEREAAEAMLAEAKLEGRRRAGLAIAADPALRQVPSPRMSFSGAPPSPPHGSPEESDTELEQTAERSQGGFTHTIGRVGSGIAAVGTSGVRGPGAGSVLNGSERWALDGSLAESSVRGPPGTQRPLTSRMSQQSHRGQTQPPPLPTRSSIHGEQSSPLQLRPSSLSRSHVPTDRGQEAREQRTKNVRSAMKEGDAFEQMDRNGGLRRERRGRAGSSPGRSAGQSNQGIMSGSPGRSSTHAPVGRSFALSGAISNDEDDSSDGEGMTGVTKQRQRGPYSGGGHKLAKQGWRPTDQGSMGSTSAPAAAAAGIGAGDSSDGDSTPTAPPPPPSVPPPAPFAGGQPPPSLPSRDRRGGPADDSDDYSTEAETMRLNQRAFVRRSPSRDASRRRGGYSPSRDRDRYGHESHRRSPNRSSRNRSRSRGRDREMVVERDTAVIVMPGGSAPQQRNSGGQRERQGAELNYDSALSF